MFALANALAAKPRNDKHESIIFFKGFKRMVSRKSERARWQEDIHRFSPYAWTRSTGIRKRTPAPPYGPRDDQSSSSHINKVLELALQPVQADQESTSLKRIGEIFFDVSG